MWETTDNILHPPAIDKLLLGFVSWDVSSDMLQRGDKVGAESELEANLAAAVEQRAVNSPAALGLPTDLVLVLAVVVVAEEFFPPTLLRRSREGSVDRIQLAHSHLVRLTVE